MVSRLNLSGMTTMQQKLQSSDGEEEDDEGRPMPMPSERLRVTEEMIDSAVGKALGDTSLTVAEKNSFRALMARDLDASFATDYYMGKSKRDNFAATAKLGRKPVTIHARPTREEAADLVAFAPEYDLKFVDDDNHCHAAGAAMRKLATHMLLDNRPRVAFKDVGGDPMLYIRLGIEDAHVCDPFEDPKDPTRAVVRRMLAQRIVGDSAWPVASRRLAQRYLDRDVSFVCGKRAQECNYRVKSSMSVHVYDIPMNDWPAIMHASGAIIHTGVVHFSSEMYSSTHGVLAGSRAEYEVDVAADAFTMGFKGSPSWWYQHSWLLYMRYGADQIIEHETGRYSYRVVQRRADTVFFEIVRVAGNALLQKQCYKLPGVKMVRVKGFEMFDGRTWDLAQGKSVMLRPKMYWFPADLWQDMLVTAKSDFERKVMTFDKLYNYYRTVSPRNTVNGVLLSGDNQVDMESVLPLLMA